MAPGAGSAMSTPTPGALRRQGAPALGSFCHRWRLGGFPFVGALPVHGRPGLSAEPGLPRAERRSRVLSGLHGPGSQTRMAGHRAFALARKSVFVAGRKTLFRVDGSNL